MTDNLDDIEVWDLQIQDLEPEDGLYAHWTWLGKMKSEISIGIYEANRALVKVLLRETNTEEEKKDFKKKFQRGICQFRRALKAASRQLHPLMIISNSVSG